ncbi:MAG: hypothetical protein VYD19_04230 [Myxococcota bacterium]|nr:hypothetical protein [Myxococcota bacterium]
MKLWTLLVGFAALILSCAETSQKRVTVPLFVAGADVSEGILSDFDVPIFIDRADLAFGPLYLCAGVNAGELCETARLEWLDSVVVDLTSTEAARAGELVGVTGTVQSWMYDLGISSQLTQEDPFILDAAGQLDGSSLLLEGRATVDGIEIPFTASVPIQQTGDTEQGVPVIRKSLSDDFSRDVRADESGLTVRFDPSSWVSGIDFRSYVSYETCSEGGPDLVCDGQVERSCEDGTEQSSRDCASQGEICLPKSGCQALLRIQPETQAYRSLRNSLMSGVRPSFNWE